MMPMMLMLRIQKQTSKSMKRGLLKKIKVGKTMMSAI